MRSKYSIITSFFLALTALCAPPQPGDADWFPIMAWGTNQHLRPANEPLTAERFREMADAGITIAGFALDRAELDMIHEAGLVAYYQDWNITSQPWTNVDPATGERDLEIPKSLMKAYGHFDCGIYAEVLDGGDIAPGDAFATEQGALALE